MLSRIKGKHLFFAYSDAEFVWFLTSHFFYDRISIKRRNGELLWLV